MTPDPLLSKLKWQVAAKLPGPQSWNKMKVVDQGLRPLNQSPGQVQTPKHFDSNPFLRNAWHRTFGKQVSQQKVQKISKTAAVPWNAMKSLWSSLRGSGAGSRSVSEMAKQFGKKGLDANTPLGKLLHESASGGIYNGMTQQIGPAFGRAFGGAYIGHQFDASDENATPWGALIGGVAGLSSPAVLRKLLGHRHAPKGSLRRLFGDRTISRRLVNDPLNRVMLSAGTGDLIDSGAGALGYDTGGWGERIGIMGGLAGGSRPLMQALSSRYKPVAKTMNALGKTRLGQNFAKAQQGGFTQLPSYLLGSPYVTGGGLGATVGMMTHGAVDATLGERVRNLAEKKKMLAQTMNAAEMEPAKKMMEDTLKKMYGPEAKFYDPDGTPSKEAIHLIQQLGRSGMMQLQAAGQNFFGNSSYLFDPQNWPRLSKPGSAFRDFVRGQAAKLHPF
jgi:hypothetical protein